LLDCHLFARYGLVYCLYVALTSLKYFLQFWRDVGKGAGAEEDGAAGRGAGLDVLSGHGQFHILFLFFVSSMFSISLCSLLGYHIHLVLHNRTTLEAFRAPVFRC
jgi:palmitoyltransferase